MPLHEDAELYDVEIMNGGTVVRTVEDLISPAWTYTAAMQIVDFGGLQTSVTFRAYQISGSVGRGTPALSTVSK